MEAQLFKITTFVNSTQADKPAARFCDALSNLSGQQYLKRRSSKGPKAFNTSAPAF